jgi:Fe2+ transport system protein FeoA
MRCQLCGFDFDESQLSCHSSCTFNKHCAIICCPNCGYQVADVSRSRVAQALGRLLARHRFPRTEDQAVCSLSQLRPSETGTILSIQTASSSRLEKLSILGLVPGAQVTLEQRQPEIVLRVGYTELSIEHDIADEIMIEPGR